MKINSNLPKLKTDWKSLCFAEAINSGLDRIKRVSEDLYFYKYNAAFCAAIYGESEKTQNISNLLGYIQVFQGCFKGRSWFKASLKSIKKADFFDSVEAQIELAKKTSNFALWLKKKNYISLCVRGRDLVPGCLKVIIISNVLLAGYEFYQRTIGEKMRYNKVGSWAIAALALNDLAMGVVCLCGITTKPLMMPTFQIVACIGAVSRRFFSSL